MKKSLLIVSLLILLTGCEANYNLSITENSMVETISISTAVNSTEIYQNKYLTDYLKDYTNIYVPIYFNEKEYDYNSGGYQEGIRFYNTGGETADKQNLILSNTFSYHDIYKSYAIKKCFNEFSVTKLDNYYILQTSDKCNAFDEYSLLSSININITTNLEVIANNADSVYNNTYTWTINRTNFQNKSLNMTINTIEDNLNDFDSYVDNKNNDQNQLDKVDNIGEKEDSDTKNDNNIVIILGLAIFCLGCILIFLFKKKDIK